MEAPASLPIHALPSVMYARTASAGEMHPQPHTLSSITCRRTNLVQTLSPPVNSPRKTSRKFALLTRYTVCSYRKRVAPSSLQRYSSQSASCALPHLIASHRIPARQSSTRRISVLLFSYPEPSIGNPNRRLSRSICRYATPS